MSKFEGTNHSYKMKRLLISGVFVVAFMYLAIGQEKTDSLTIKDGPKSFPELQFNLEHAFDVIYPTNTPVIKNQQMLHQVFEYNNEAAKNYQYFMSPYNAFYYYSDNGFTFLQNSSPMFFDFAYHTKGTFISKKTDLFVDGSGGIYNDYFPTDGITIPGNVRGFIWELGIGAGYKISSKSTIFIKGSVLMNNINPYSTKELGGMNIKF